MANYPQIYVPMELGGKHTEAFTFYKIDKPGKMLFWFAHKGSKEQAAFAIAKGLEKHFSKR
jgi:hypothetical protein